MIRTQFVYLLAATVVVIAGLASRRYRGHLPAFLAEYAGDTLWALMNVALRPEASSDLVSAAAYFNDISDGWVDHFLNTIEVDLADLRDEAGIHAMHYGLPCKFAKVFPFAIYYRVETESAIVYAILSCRMSPDAHRSILERRL